MPSVARFFLYAVGTFAALRGLNALVPLVNERLMKQREYYAELERQVRLRRKRMLAERKTGRADQANPNTEEELEAPGTELTTAT
jgi:uncharacterized membrane protein YgaE (UPF0421/DUF939 family)